MTYWHESSGEASEAFRSRIDGNSSSTFVINLQASKNIERGDKERTSSMCKETNLVAQTLNAVVEDDDRWNLKNFVVFVTEAN
jgi:hypothetical protein